MRYEVMRDKILEILTSNVLEYNLHFERKLWREPTDEEMADKIMDLIEDKCENCGGLL